MKKTIMATMVAIAFLSVGCNHGNGELVNEKQAQVIEQYVDHTIAPTYSNLALYTEQLVNDLGTFRASGSQSDLNKVCETFLSARAWWEKCEAFLYGAASDFGIDPHIDSWPLDVDAFNNLMSSPSMLTALAGEDGDVVAGEQLGNALLGFHGIEYILFSNGQPRNATEITASQMDYAVAGDWGNGYLLVVTDQNDNYISSLTGMPQTKAVPPFKAPIDESQIQISWLDYTDEWGNRFPDGETYSLIYPEVYIPASAYYVPLESNGTPIAYGSEIVRLESTIGIYGTGLLDAIPDDSLKAQYLREYTAGAKLNPAMWAGGDWAPTGLYGKTNHPKRFTYACSRGPLQDGPGANAIWNITNVTRSDRRYHYMTETYARVASQDPDVQASFYTYFPEYNKTGNPETDIYNYLMSKDLPAEMSNDDYVNLMVWHRGLAVPAARHLDDPEVQKGRKLFREIGCTACHRPSWTTGPDRFTDPNGFFTTADQRLPRYPNQKIWPYTDMVQHRLCMKNDIRTGWCRTTPLWGRGLSSVCTGSSDRLHDCRARNVIEAIMWHGSSQSDARWTVEKFRNLSKEERDAVVKFINAI